MIKSPRFTLMLIIGIFFVPLFCAYFVFALNKAPDQTTNVGHLLKPMPQFAELNLQQANGTAMEASQIKHRWWLLYVVAENCDTDCSNELHTLRQIHRALGKNYARVGRLLVAMQEQADLQKFNAIKTAYPDLFLTSSAATSLPLTQAKQQLFLMDPLGNVLMRYDADSPPKGIIKDIKHLLKLSRIG